MAAIKWINSREKLPREGDIVAACGTIEMLGKIQKWRASALVFNYVNGIPCFGGYPADNVTQWMLLAEPKKYQVQIF